MSSSHRSPIFELSDKYVTAWTRISPMDGTEIGSKDRQDQLDDFSHKGLARKAILIKETLKQLNSLSPLDDIDGVAKAVLEERLNSKLGLLESNESLLSWGVINSPVILIRKVFELMPYGSDEEISNITHRLNSVDVAHRSWVKGLSYLAGEGQINSRRQVEGVIKQLRTFSEGAYSAFATHIDPAGTYPGLHEAAREADASALSTSNWLSDKYLPSAPERDGVGEARYLCSARDWTGADLDLRAIYEWGLQDLEEINQRMWQVAAKIKPDAKTLGEIADYLEKDPKYLVSGTDVLLEKLRAFTEDAVQQMDGIHFDMDDRIKFCDVLIAPEGSSAAPYYQGPSEDLSRPGTTWFPTLGKNEFSWWRLPSIWYHEAVPGHHLQVATAAVQKDRQSRFQRAGEFGSVSGYAEGWALYAERLMDELGAYEDPGVEMGFLSAQALRAARIVVDIGLHLGYLDYEGQAWSADAAVRALIDRALIDEDFARSEVDRYLAMPGQAISYKVGEKFWLEARESAKMRLGSKFDLKKFHAHALNMGSMGLDPFATEMAKWDGA